MGKELAEKYPSARAVFDEADKALGFSISQMCFAGSEEDLKQTANTQPAILTCSVAIYRVLAERGLTPDFVAGHSLGEYSALVAAGSLKFADAVELVRKRGTYMQDAVPAGVGAMAAIMGLSPAVVADACNAVLTPVVGARTSLIMGEVIPGIAIRTVVLADRAPLPLAQVRTPLFPWGLGYTRFFQSSKGGFFKRFTYAASRIVITRGDSGKKEFNFSEIFGAAAASTISTYSYHPHPGYHPGPGVEYIASDRTISNTLSVWGSQVGYDTITLVIKEFWPDIRRKVKKQPTTEH